MRISKRHMLVRLLSVLLVLGMLAFLAVSCKPAGPADGTITVRLINAIGYDTDVFMYGIYKEGVDYETGVADGFGMVEIDAAGEAQDTARDPASILEPMIFTGGESYYIFAFIDEAPENATPDPGEYACVGSDFTVDGNMTKTLDFGDFDQIPPP